MKIWKESKRKLKNYIQTHKCPKFVITTVITLIIGRIFTALVKSWTSLKNYIQTHKWLKFIITTVIALIIGWIITALVKSFTSRENQPSVQTLSDMVASKLHIDLQDVDLNVLYQEDVIVAYGQYITGEKGEDFYDGRGVFLFEQAEPSYIDNLFGRDGEYKLTYYIRCEPLSTSVNTLYLTRFNISNINRINYDEFVLSLHTKFATRESDLYIMLTRDDGDWKVVNFDYTELEEIIKSTDPNFKWSWVTDFPFWDNNDNKTCLYSLDIYGTELFYPNIMRESAACLIGLTYSCGEATLEPHKVALIMCKFDPTDQSKLVVDKIWNNGNAVIIDEEDIPESTDYYKKFFESEMWAWKVEDGIKYEAID